MKDLEIFDLEDFMYNDVNITSYRLVDYSNPVVRGILNEIINDNYHVGKHLLHRGQLIKVKLVKILFFFKTILTILITILILVS